MFPACMQDPGASYILHGEPLVPRERRIWFCAVFLPKRRTFPAQVLTDRLVALSFEGYVVLTPAQRR